MSDRLGRPLTDDEVTQVNTLLEDVELEIKARIPNLADKVADEDYLAIVIKVEASAVRRVVRNPDGYTAETDGNYSYQLNWRLNTGEIELTDKDWADLGISSGVSTLNVRAKTPYERAANGEFGALAEPQFWFPI